MQKTPVVLPIDGKKSGSDVLIVAESLLSNPKTRAVIGFIKLNDAFDVPDMTGIELCRKIKGLIKKYKSPAGIFLDFKLADTSDTNYNKMMHLVNAGINPDILTFRESISAKAMLKLRLALPNTKLALVSAPTDTPEDECRRKSGMFPHMKILNDATNVQAEYEAICTDDTPKKAFDMIVCSPLELVFLVKNFPYQYQYIVPGIRDEWMSAGQQSRYTGIRTALNNGATYCVAGSQMTKGNPKKEISAELSQEKTIAEINAASYSFMCAENPIMVLHHCGGRYESPKDKQGNQLGPLVAYAGKDSEGKNKVGFVYFNFAKVEENPIALNFYAAMLAEKIRKTFLEENRQMPNVVLGMANGGTQLASTLAYHLGCRCAIAFKKEVKSADERKGQKAETILQIERHEIYPGDMVLTVEDVCNNFSTTEKSEKLINLKNATMVGVASAINRANDRKWNDKPVISACHIPSPQFTQDQTEVASHIANSNISWNPKEDWSMLMEAMTSAVK